MAADRPNPELPIFKIVLVGDGCTGKTTFVKRHKTGAFEKRYLATVNCVIHYLTFYYEDSQGRRGGLVFQVWDTAGQEKFGGLRDAYYIDGKAAIIMFDLASKPTFDSIPQWKRDLNRVCGKRIPIVLCGNKMDRRDRKLNARQIGVYRRQHMHYVEISAKTNHNVERPFLYLAQALKGDTTLRFTQQPALLPPKAVIDPEMVRRSDAIMAEAAQAPIADDEEDIE